MVVFLRGFLVGRRVGVERGWEDSGGLFLFLEEEMG